METETIRQYIREYSYIEGFQQAYRVCYRLFRCQGTLWLSVGDVCRQLKGLSEAYAGNLLLYLYENSVSARMACDVMEDLCGPMAVPPKGRDVE